MREVRELQKPGKMLAITENLRDMNYRAMKTTPSLTTATLITSAFLLSAPASGWSQQYQQGYYAPPQESGIKRVGRSVGNFFRRSFYGEAPTYTPPPAGYTPSSYSLDGPPVGGATYANVNSYSAAPGAPAYKKPTTTTKTASTKKPTTTKAPATTTKSKSSTSSSSSKRYTPPSKPSSFKKAPSHPADDTPARTETVKAPEENPLPLPNSTPDPIADTPPSPPKTEAKLTQTAMNNTFPLPGSSPTTHTISPTISDEPINLGPTSMIKDEPPVKTTTTTSSTSSGTAKSGSFLVGKKTNKPGRVVSPYAPYNELDITGLPAGSLALDPTTQKVFQVP
jgi:hypothetical protein